ncbi:MAG TPA: DUF4835 domain-containing protein, partial [Dysgonomonas sp.]|nr:DUF4835 domain-containing protein [Dysgonomonas sp.]
MKKKICKSIFMLVVLLNVMIVHSQEMNMRLTINVDRIQGTDNTVYTALQDNLSQMVNGRKWTDLTFQQNEKIDCSMLITINSEEQDVYNAEIQITVNRPVYNSSYTTPLFNYRDTEFEFNYIAGQNLEFSENNVDNNLTAVIAYYVYIILGLDFDSFSLNGGKPYFEKAMSIANSAQSLNSTKGWNPFGNDRNRYALALAFTEESSAVFHPMWYNYHRKGLDEMVANPTRGRVEIEKTIPDLQKIRQSRPASPILS